MLFRNIFVYPKYPKKLERLFTLAYNLWSLWDNDAIRIFYRIDPALFRDLRKNPVKFLHSLTKERMDQLADDQGFLYELDKIWDKFTAYVEHKADRPELCQEYQIAYFTMEYGLHLTPNYAGGLGILAGDILKGVSDMSIPMTGVSLFYKYGYFRQRLNINGEQEEIYDENNIYYLPVKEEKSPQGEPAYVTINILNTPVRVKLWRINVGKVKLILLDTDLEENPPVFRTITDYLYVADRDKRIMQEIILGLGGMRALEAIGVHPQVYHLNEGHSAFLILERLKKLINEQNYSIEEAYTLIKSSTVFTTHTPIEAGNENFNADMVKKYLEKDIKSLGMSVEQFLEFGFLHDKKTFWLPALAIRFSQYINGVSRIHSHVSKRMWKDLFPQKMILEIPIVNITNGVHYSWLSNEMRYLFDSYLGPGYIYSGDNEEIWEKILDIPWPHSPGRFYETITLLLGFRPARHEGKITGLAALGDPDVLADYARGLFHIEEDRDDFYLSPDVHLWRWDYRKRKPGRALPTPLRPYSHQDIAAAWQVALEQAVVALVERYLRRYPDIRHVALAGGVHGNVKLNQRINELDAVEEIYVHPGMSDCGQPVGAALACWA